VLRVAFPEFRRPKRSTIGLHLVGLGAVLTIVHFNFNSSFWALGGLLGLTCILAGLLFASKASPRVFLSNLPIAIPVGILLLSSLVGVFIHGQSSTDLLYLVLLVVGVLVFLVGWTSGRKALVWAIPVALMGVVPVVVEGLGTPDSGGSWITGNTGLMGLVFGLAIMLVLVFLRRGWRWLAAPLLLGVFFTGDHWTWLALGGVVVVVLVMRDWKRVCGIKAVLGMGIALVLMGLLSMFWGYLTPLYGLDGTPLALAGPGEDSSGETRVTSWEDSSRDTWTTLGWRVPVFSQVLKNWTFLGHGVQLDTTGQSLNRYEDLVHNVPLMILDDLGPTAAAAWVFLVVWSAVKSRELRYVLVFVLLISVFSYWFWWPLGLQFYFWLVLGAALGEKSSPQSRLVYLQRRFSDGS